MTEKEQQALMDKGKTLVGEDGTERKMCPPSPGQAIFYTMRAARSKDGTWFYGTGYFNTDETVRIKNEQREPW